MTCRICDERGNWSSLDAPFPDLCNAAKLGCQLCSMIRDGIRQFADDDDVTTTSISKPVESGHRRPLRVKFSTRIQQTTLEFYSTSPSVTKVWPHIPLAAHISADSSSSECLSLAQKWLDQCTQNHSSLRCPSAGTQATLPSRVVCVGDAFTDPYLYESAAEEKGVWAALSYCWGNTRTMTTTIASISERKVGFSMETLPKTIRDAIIVARALSIPYVWVDSFCIIQDSAFDWEKEAARMCYVYENALVTFAALHSPSSDTGLFLSNPYRRTITLNVHINDRTDFVYARQANNFGILSIVHGHSKHSDTDALRGSGILEMRGWTLQELALSPRIIWFTSFELGWSCWTSTACECEPAQTSEYIDGSAKYCKVSSKPTPMLSQNIATEGHSTWRTLVQAFTKRKLTVQTDRLPAISGLASALHSHTNSRYLAGLWESDLDNQLLWVSISDISEDSVMGWKPLVLYVDVGSLGP